MGAQIPILAEKPLVSCGCKKFKVDTLGDHLNTLFVPITRVPRRLTTGRLVNLLTFFAQHIQQKLNRSRGQHCGDVELVGYLANTAGPVPLVLHLRISHDRFGSSSDPILNGQLHYPTSWVM